MKKLLDWLLKVLELVFLVLLCSSVGSFLCLTNRTRENLFGNNIDFSFLPETVEEDYLDVFAIQEVVEQSILAFSLTGQATKEWAKAIGLLSVLLWRALQYCVVESYQFLVPHLHTGWELFASQDPWNILMEVTTIVSIFLLWMLKRFIARQRYPERIRRWYRSLKEKISRRWNSFLDNIRKRSLTAAKLVATFLPHLALMIPMAALIYFLPNIAASMSTGWTLMMVSLGLPLVTTVYALQAGPTDHSSSSKSLMYWVLFSIIMICRELIPYIPFSWLLFEQIPYKAEIGFFFFLWLQLPVTNGVTFLYQLIVPLISRYLTRVPNISAPVSRDQSNFLLRMLVAANIISDEKRSVFSELFWASGWTLLGLIFFITGGQITAIGCIFVGLVVPCYTSIKGLGMMESAQRSGHTDQTQTATLYVHSLLKYWICLVLFWLSYELAGIACEWLPLWFHVKLAVLMWLQLPFFKGAEKLYDKLVGSTISAWIEKRRKYSSGSGGVGAVSSSEDIDKIDQECEGDQEPEE